MTTKKVLKWFGGKIFPSNIKQGCRLSVLNYHSVGGGSLGSLSTERFSSHLAAITKTHNYCAVDINKGLNLTNNCTGVLITFDDGYLDNYLYAAPLLEDNSIQAAFFITTAFVEGELDITATFRNYDGLKPMSWDQIGKLHERGHSIGFHGHKHRSFATFNTSQILDEMARSAELFRHRLGISPNVFAYPYGQLENRHPEMTKIASLFGIRYVFSTENRSIDVCKLKNFKSKGPLPRLRVDADDSPLIIKDKIEGRWDYISNIQRVRSCIRLKSLSAYRAIY